MAYSAITKAVANVVMEAKFSAIDDLIIFLEAKIEVDEDLKAMFEEFKTNLKESEEKVVKAAGKKPAKGKGKSADSDEPKKKRAPSVFNLYVKDVMPKMKLDHPDIKDGKLLIGFASESWKSDPMAAYIKEKVLEMKKDDKDGDVVDMYAEAKALYEGLGELDEEEEKPKKKASKEVVEKPKKTSKASTSKASTSKAAESDEEKEIVESDEENEESEDEGEKVAKGKKSKK